MSPRAPGGGSGPVHAVGPVDAYLAARASAAGIVVEALTGPLIATSKAQRFGWLGARRAARRASASPSDRAQAGGHEPTNSVIRWGRF